MGSMRAMGSAVSSYENRLADRYSGQNAAVPNAPTADAISAVSSAILMRGS
jgi:hypothetical protein